MLEKIFVTNSESLIDKKLVEAVESGNVKFAEYYLREGANINLLNDSETLHEGETLLHLAVQHNHKEMVEFLIDKGLDVDKEAFNGYTPLNYAAVYNSGEAAKALLEKGANIYTNPRDVDGNILQHAIWSGASDVIKVICEKNKELVNIPNHKGNTPLHLLPLEASKYVTEERIKEATSKLVDTANVLIKSGADVNAKNDYDETPLHFAVEYEYLNLVETLIKNGADVNSKNNFSKTPLYEAVENEVDPEITTELLKNGADPLIKNKWDETVFDIDGRYLENTVRNYNEENPEDPITLPEDPSSADNMEK